MWPRRLALGISFTLLAAVPVDVSAAQACAKTFGPLAATFRPSPSVSYDQVWSVPARGPSLWTFVWSEGNDISASSFDLDLNRYGSAFRVNTYTPGTQDEPAIGYATTGKFLVAWSERNGYDGSQMGILGRVFDVNGIPIGNDFQINANGYTSQWRPLIASTPSGGWVVAWSGNWDGDAFFRVLDANGAFTTGDVLVNTFTYDAQVDPAVAVNEDGTIFVAFVDYSSHASVGSGLDLYGRTFDASGVPHQTQEFMLTTYGSDGDQRGPRVATDGLGRFWVVWASQVGDGSGYGIYERVFDRNGVPLIAEFQVNTTTSGDQGNPVIVVDDLGRALVAWEDSSQGGVNSTIRGRRYNAQGGAFGDDFLLSDGPTFGARLPNLAIDPSGTEIMVGYQGPGTQGNGVDVYARPFATTTGPHTYCAAKVNSLGCIPSIGWTGTPSATSTEAFTIHGSQILSHKLGLLVYGFGSAFTSYQGTLLCVAQPLKRIARQDSGGTSGGTNCTGSLSTDFNARIRSGIDPGLAAGTTVSARWYYRDPQDPAGFGSGLTDAIRFAICP